MVWRTAIASIFEAALVAGLERRLGIHMSEFEGTYEIPAIPRSLCRIWSKRNKAIHEQMAAEGYDYHADLGRREVAAMRTRQRTLPPASELIARHHAEAATILAEMGLTAEHIIDRSRLPTPRFLHAENDRAHFIAAAAIQDITSDEPAHLVAQAMTRSRGCVSPITVLRALAAALPDEFPNQSADELLEMAFKEDPLDRDVEQMLAVHDRAEFTAVSERVPTSVSSGLVVASAHSGECP
jgi:hypothetical protein